MSTTNEGYVKYSAVHKAAPATEVPHWAELNEARTKLHQLGLVGILPNGVGYGNVSIRFQQNEFLISGTATGAPAVLGLDGYCIVESFDLNQNCVVSTGPTQASSESMTHGIIYQSSAAVNCVIHVHSRAIFDGMLKDRYPSTPKKAAFGTPEIATVIGRLVKESNTNQGLIVLAGHDEGIVSYGTSIETALTLIQELYNKYMRDAGLEPTAFSSGDPAHF
jgi:ribulose-5-phosphate 4-epimerase/fuculose-1-phosphate aldolase